MENSNLFLKWFSKVSGVKCSYCKWVFNRYTKSYNLMYYALNNPYEKRLVLYNDNDNNDNNFAVFISLVDKERCFEKLGGKKIYWRIKKQEWTDTLFNGCVVPKDKLELELELMV